MSNYCQPESGWGVTLGVFFLLFVVSLLACRIFISFVFDRKKLGYCMT
jgi:hypothetical protein